MNHYKEKASTKSILQLLFLMDIDCNTENIPLFSAVNNFMFMFQCWTYFWRIMCWRLAGWRMNKGNIHQDVHKSGSNLIQIESDNELGWFYAQGNT